MSSHRMPPHPASHPRTARGRQLAVLAFVAALLLTGCAKHSADTSPERGSQTGFPVTLTPPDGEKVTLRSRPSRIVSLSPAETETLYGINAGQQVVAVDKDSDYPQGVPVSDIDALRPDIEAIAGYQPDLVIASDDTGGLVTGLKKIGVPVLVLQAPQDLDQTYAEWRTLGRATGHTKDAGELV
ncbi:MAG: ABC transporter substrate-binding protein, partial [Sciscionella sp.]